VDDVSHTAAEPLTLDIDRPAAGGRMLARHDGQVVLVAGAIPGERVRARIERTQRGVVFARVEEILTPSADRRQPPHEVICGGAALAHIAYPRQLAIKADVIADAFRRIAKIPLAAPIEVAASPEHGYRVRARLHVRDRRAGFFREGTHTLCDAAATGQMHDGALPAVDALLRAIDHRLAECEAVTVVENIPAAERVLHLEPRDGARLTDLQGRVKLPDGATGVTTGDKRLTTIAGQPTVSDSATTLGVKAAFSRPVAWTRHATSFFQANRHLVGALVDHVIDVAVAERFVDLYAGVGLFSIALAGRGGRGIAVEGDAGSGRDLVTNAAAWRDHLRVVGSSVEAFVAHALDPAPDVVVVDPPRVGMSPEALQGLVAWRAARIVYVSCDPPTLARDAARLVQAGYAISAMRAFDLFPNTPHVEAVVVFER
jgi:23S rRNA (uracil1939-C5)-methyltransferase